MSPDLIRQRKHLSLPFWPFRMNWRSQSCFSRNI